MCEPDGNVDGNAGSNGDIYIDGSGDSNGDGDSDINGNAKLRNDGELHRPSSSDTGQRCGRSQLHCACERSRNYL